MSTSAPPAQLAELLADRVEWVTGCSECRTHCTERTECGFHCTADHTVLVLLRSLRLPDVLHGAREFAAGLDPDEAAAWRRSWTRTRFLFGNPANLTARPRVVGPGGTAAWLGPFPHDHLPGVSRLLKPVSGALRGLPTDVYLPGSGQPRVLQVAVAGLSLVDYLVHLHHTLAEAVLLGRLRPDEPLRLSHALEIETTSAPPAYARVLPEPGDTGRLRLHTWLS